MRRHRAGGTPLVGAIPWMKQAGSGGVRVVGLGLVFMKAESSTEQGDKLAARTWAARSWDGGESFWWYE